MTEAHKEELRMRKEAEEKVRHFLICISNFSSSFRKNPQEKFIFISTGTVITVERFHVLMLRKCLLYMLLDDSAT